MVRKITEKPWHKRWWVVSIFVICGLSLLFTIAMLTLFGRYYWGFLKQMKLNDELLASQSAPRQLVETSDDPFIGNANAKVVIVEFSDFLCDYCRQEYAVVKEVVKRYKRDVKLIYRDFPIETANPVSFQASLAANCAQAQGKFWAYHDKLFTETAIVTRESLIKYARELGLQEEEFRQCLASERFRSEIEQDLFDAVDAGVSGTPSFFVNGVRVQGAVPIETWEELMKLFLQQ